MEKKRGIDSFTLHILAMLFMLCDHLWATLFPAIVLRQTPIDVRVVDQHPTHPVWPVPTIWTE